MLVLLPPSETKAPGGDGPPLDFDTLSHPALNPVRRKLAEALADLAHDVPASLAALGLSERQHAEVARNEELFDAPTTPALHRYTGVLYDALDAGSLTGAAARRAHERLAVASALFGIARAGDPIPAYRLSGGNVLPGVGPLRELWRPALEPELSEVDELLVDLRSGAYAALARLPPAVTVRVVSIDGAGKRTTVSHFNKAYKGKLARALVSARTEPKSVTGLLRVASAAGLTVHRTGERELEMLAE
ncbi:MAG TPA: peroxide stress protein YaaA [Pseudonocardiaceae bacterium]|nr:peroxide stress protein YaaA [Pseudonocardiaceae bacterium]